MSMSSGWESVVSLDLCTCRCILAAPYLACLKGGNTLGILFFVNVLDPTDPTPDGGSMIVTDKIFGAGAQGPYKLESVPGDESVVVVSAENGLRKRLIVVGKVPVPIQRDISGDAGLYVTFADNKKVLLETTYKDGVNIRFFNSLVSIISGILI